MGKTSEGKQNSLKEKKDRGKGGISDSKRGEREFGKRRSQITQVVLSMSCLRTNLPPIFLLINLRLDQDKGQYVRRFINTIHKQRLLIPHQDRKQLLVHRGKKETTTIKQTKNQTVCNSQLCFALCSKYLVLTACENAHFECVTVLMADKKSYKEHMTSKQYMLYYLQAQYFIAFLSTQLAGEI